MFDAKKNTLKKESFVKYVSYLIMGFMYKGLLNAINLSQHCIKNLKKNTQIWVIFFLLQISWFQWVRGKKKIYLKYLQQCMT